MASSVSAPFTLPDRYRIEGPVASGGMASVWAAHDTLLDRPVAVKVLAEHLNEDISARERFQREARAAAALSSHPSVVTIYDVGEHEGRSFIVMELRRGGTLADVLRAGGAVEPARALGWLAAAAAALDAAHAAGVVHRDIKPANLLLDEQDRLSVADFGIARLAYEEQVTATGQILGTASYISPEQALGEPATEASDRYALAVVAFELLCGRKPFSAEHFAAQARAHIEQDPPAASDINPKLPRAVDAVLARGLDKEPSRRWPSAAVFVEELEQAISDDRTAATALLAGDGRFPDEPATAVQPVAAPPPRRPGSAPQPPHSRPLPSPPGHGGQNRAPLVVGALLALALIAILAAVLLGGGDDPGGDQTSDEPRATTTADAERTPTAEPTAQATEEAAEAPPASSPSSAPAAGGEDLATARRENDRGFQRFQAGDYAGAVPFLQRAVEACGDSKAMDPCGYALYNLGASLNRAGNPQEALPLLERRLERFGDNDAGDVQREIDAARAALESGGTAPGKGNGKGKGKKSDD